MTDALAACIFSSKLQPNDRFWALNQLLKMFTQITSTNSGRKTADKDRCPTPTQLLSLKGHTGQIMNNRYCTSNNTLYTISEDFTLRSWTISPPTDSTSTVLPMNDAMKNEGAELLLPVLELNCNKTCISLACGKVVSIWRVSIWRVRDSSCVSITLPNLITDLKWRTNEAAAEPPILLVGLIDGTLASITVHKVSVSLPMETNLEIINDELVLY